MAGNEQSDNSRIADTRVPNAAAGTPSGRAKSTARGKAQWVLLAIIAVAAIAGVWFWFYMAVREITDDAQIDGHISPIAAKVSGSVLRVYVKDNQPVDAGTLLLEIDPQDYQLAVERARADLAVVEAAAKAAGASLPGTTITAASQLSSAQALLKSAEARVTVAAREIDGARARLGPLQARLRESEALHTRSTQDLERMKQLLAKDEISRQQFDAAIATADAARAARDAAMAAVPEAEKGVASAEARLVQARAGIAEAQAAVDAAGAGPSQVAITRSNIAAAEARILQARAGLDRAQLDLEYTKVFAPTAGVVSMKKVEVGQVVQREQPLMALVQLDNVWVTANFKEDQLHEMRVGQLVIIAVDAFGGRQYRGHVDSLAAASGARFSLLPPENASGNYVKVVQRFPVKIVFEQGQDPEHLLRPGMSVVPTVFVK
jgi:membrane fusion protein, multidrug efflux system